MDLLIDAGADVNHQADGGNTALRQVVSRRMLRHTIVFLSRMSGRDLDPAQSEGYEMALAYAEKLLEAGADPDVTYEDESNKKLVDEANEQGDEELRELLQRFGAELGDESEDEDEDEDKPAGDRLIIAASHSNVEQVTEILESGVDVNHLDSDGDTALGLCVLKLCTEELEPQRLRDFFELIDLLLEHGAQVDVPGCRVAPLPMVARSGSLALTNAFLRAGANPNAVMTDMDHDAGKTALEVAREGGHDEVVAALLAAQD
jgi:ankyrin repeat protein